MYLQNIILIMETVYKSSHSEALHNKNHREDLWLYEAAVGQSHTLMWAVQGF